MSGDFASLNVLIVSDSSSEREAMRNAASHGSAVIEIADLDRIADGTLLANRNVDVIFLDSRMPHETREVVVATARVVPSKPIIISVGLKPNSVPAEATAFDGNIARPIQAAEVRAKLDACTRLRQPSRIIVGGRLPDHAFGHPQGAPFVPSSLRNRGGGRWG